MERTVYMIKPEGMEKREPIVNSIQSAGLRVVSTKLVTLDTRTLFLLYPDLAGDMLTAHQRFLMCGQSEIGILEGPCAISMLVDVAGMNTNPNLCNVGTIRERYGEKTPEIVGSAKYWKNAFHRSKNESEAIRDIDIFRNF